MQHTTRLRLLLRRLGFAVLAAALVVALLFISSNLYVAVATGSLRYDTPAAAPGERVAIIFGAGVRPDGRVSRILADRVNAGVALYQSGQVEKLLMTGDNSRVDYDEVTAMQRYAVERGVAEADITLDYAGFRTYDSCYRAHAIFGVEEAILVTQQFHLPRAVYTCQQLGIDAVGVGTQDWGAYPDRMMVIYTIRESLATANALVELHITRPLPTFLGPFEGLN